MAIIDFLMRSRAARDRSHGLRGRGAGIRSETRRAVRAWVHHGLLASALLTLPQIAAQPNHVRGPGPNILVVIADDWSYPHAGAYGDATVATPAFDRLAREGVLFTHAFAAVPSCSASRASLLTGQAAHRLAEGANLWGTLPARFAVYPDLLERADYFVGHTGKGWGPGRPEPGGRTRNPAGPRFENFDAFLAARRPGQRFAFWLGSADPHRPYEPGSGARSGLSAARVRVPAFLPDADIVRQDLLDYYAEVQRFDAAVGAALETLSRVGELDHTLVVVTSDNGMPFPRAKANLYDAGVRVPLVLRWPGRLPAGVRSDALVVLTDLAPTFLAAAGLAVPSQMTGRSLLDPTGRDSRRDRVFLERERHANVRAGDAGYPARAVRDREFLYIRNVRPDRWPAGDPTLHYAVGPFGDIDDGPTKQLLLAGRGKPDAARFFALAMEKRPGEELYDVRRDPDQLVNLAARAEYAAARERLARALSAWQQTTGDPRAGSDDDRWDRFPYYGGPAAREPRAVVR
jgi:arylsulfatase A-like enzyme